MVNRQENSAFLLILFFSQKRKEYDRIANISII